MSGHDDAPTSFASPPCFLHEVDPVYMGLADAADLQQRSDVMRWRKAERQRLIASRLEIDGRKRQRDSETIADTLLNEIGAVAGVTFGVYWPVLGEPDLRGLMTEIVARGGRSALPVVVERGRPLIFRSWASGDRLESGVWNIPVPAGGEEVEPDAIIAPVVGFDRSCHRLGYGDGCYDRTLAASSGKLRVFGIGFALAGLPTIYPQPHDIPMDMVVTEKGVTRPASRSEPGRACP